MALLLLKTSLFIAFLWTVSSEDIEKTDDRSTYVCWEEKCVVKITLDKSIATNLTKFQSMDSCRLVCGKYGTLWPIPTSPPLLGNNLVLIDPLNVKMVIGGGSEVKKYMNAVFEIFIQNLKEECGGDDTLHSDNLVIVNVKVQDPYVQLNATTNEAYEISISSNNSGSVDVSISAPTVFGARHALETLSQLTSRTRKKGSCRTYIIDSASIKDRPIYKHRGLLIDTSRHYFPVEDLERTIRGMAANKLNVFHWHATDSHSFPLVLNRVPSLAKLGAYSEKEVYTERDVTYLVNYAKLRGIRILMEIDSPAHAGNGWHFGEKEGLGKLVLCRNYNPWRAACAQPPCGQLNPANPNLYKVLGDLYKNLQDLIPSGELFHMGGDEVFIPCWTISDEISNYMKDKGYSLTNEGYMKLWAEFHNKALKVWDKVIGHSKTKIVLWTSDLTDPDNITNYLDKSRYIIEAWTGKYDQVPQRLLDLGYELIYASLDAWYLDHGINDDITYHNWKTVYDNEIPRHPKVLGGEAALWTEYVDSNCLDNRLWPRAAALAERLWSSPVTDSNAATYRLLEARERMIRRGIKVDQIVPEWCYLNEGFCEYI